MKFLITGGCGFIGTAFASHLLASGGHSVRVLDNLSGGSIADLEQVGKFAHLSADNDFSDSQAPLALHNGDTLDPEAMERALTGAEVVIHLAANTRDPHSVAVPCQACHPTVMAALNIANDFLNTESTLSTTRSSADDRVRRLSDRVTRALSEHKQLDL